MIVSPPSLSPCLSLFLLISFCTSTDMEATGSFKPCAPSNTSHQDSTMSNRYQKKERHLIFDPKRLGHAGSYQHLALLSFSLQCLHHSTDPFDAFPKYKIHGILLDLVDASLNSNAFPHSQHILFSFHITVEPSLPLLQHYSILSWKHVMHCSVRCSLLILSTSLYVGTEMRLTLLYRKPHATHDGGSHPHSHI